MSVPVLEATGHTGAASAQSSAWQHSVECGAFKCWLVIVNMNNVKVVGNRKWKLISRSPGVAPLQVCVFMSEATVAVTHMGV